MKRIIACIAAILVIGIQLGADEPFRKHRNDALNNVPVKKGSIMFIGDSITDMFEWWEAFGCNPKVMNRGVSGALSHELLDNLDAVVAAKPKKVFLMIGTNDLGTKGLDKPEIPFANICKAVERIHCESPRTEIYVQSVLPVAKNDKRRAVDIIALNGMLAEWCAAQGYVFVDLWPLLVEPGTTHLNPSYTLDGLHLLASGYAVWCKAIEKYVGIATTLTDPHNGSSGLPGSYGMRSSYFASLPVNKHDRLIIGDEMVKAGEWHDLLKDKHVKNRGMGWGYPGPSFDYVISSLDDIFNMSDGSIPSDISIYCGSADLRAGKTVEECAQACTRLINELKIRAPKARLSLISLLPTKDVEFNNTKVIPFNDIMIRIAAEHGIKFIELYGSFSDPSLMDGNYVSGKGYIRFAELAF